MQPILDVCCGGRMFYFDKQDPRVLFCDNRYFETTLCDGRKFEVKPDIIADFTQLPFADNTYQVVVFDPPHLLRNTGMSKFKVQYGTLAGETDRKLPTGYQQVKYGASYSDWQDMLQKGFKECFRVLKPNGVLIFKWSDIDIKVNEILKLTEQKPVFGHKSGRLNKTHWICFMKGESDE